MSEAISCHLNPACSIAFVNLSSHILNNAVCPDVQTCVNVYMPSEDDDDVNASLLYSALTSCYVADERCLIEAEDNNTQGSGSMSQYCNNDCEGVTVACEADSGDCLVFLNIWLGLITTREPVPPASASTSR